MSAPTIGLGTALPAARLGRLHRVSGLARLIAPLAAGIAVPVLTFLMVRNEPLFVVSMCAALVPLLTLTRPERFAAFAVPMVTLAPAFPTVREPLMRGVALALLVAIVLQVARGSMTLRPAHGWIAALAAAVAVSLMLPVMPLPAKDFPLSDATYLIVGLGLLALAVSAPPPPAQLAVAVTVSGALAAGYVLYAGSSEDGRLTGLGLNPNYLGAALVVPLVTAAGMAWSRRRVSWLLPAAPCLAALLATQSRGAILAVAAGALLVALTMAQPRHRAWILALCAGGAAVMLLGGLGWAQELALGGRTSAELDRNNSIRADIAWFALRVISENPLRGIGYGMFPPYAARQVGTYINTHNDYLRLAVEGGPVMLALFVLLLWLGLRHRQAGDLVVVRAAVLAYAVSLVFANTLANLPVTAAFWVALGCLIGRSGKSDRPAAPRAGTGEAAGRC